MSTTPVASLYNRLYKCMKMKDTESIREVIIELTSHHENITPFLITFYDSSVVPNWNRGSEIVRLGSFTKKMIGNFVEEFCTVACSLAQAQTQRLERTVATDDDDAAVETLMINYGTKRFPEIASFEHLMKPDMFDLLNVTYYRLKHKDSDGIQSILSFLLRHKSITLEEVPPYPEIKHIKFGRNDVVWYLWSLLLIFLTYRAPSKNTTHMYEHVTWELAVFTTMYQKKYRMSRLQILIEAFRMVCTGSAPVRPVVVATPVVIDAKEDKDMATTVVVESKDRVDYLMCFTIKDDTVSNEVEKDRQKNRCEYKDLLVN